MKVITKNEIFIIIFVSVLIVIPFLNQAYHIDDWVYLKAAVEYNNSGFNSVRGTSTQDGMVFPNFYITHPLLYPLFLSYFIKIFQTIDEHFLHLISVLSLTITGISSLIISKKFSRAPLITTLFMLLIPATMLMAHVVMTDIPTLAFFLLALALHIQGVEKKSLWLLILSGIAAAIAVGISYQALFVVLLFILFNIQRKERSFILYISGIIPLSLFILWCLFTWKEFGFPHPFIAFLWAGDNNKRTLLDIFSKFMGNINSLGASTIFPIFITVSYSIKPKFRKLIIISFMLALLSIFLVASGYSLVQKFLFFIYAGAGYFLVLRMISLFRDSLIEKNNNSFFITTWFVSFFISIAVLMPLGISRYLLPAILPVIIVIINDLMLLFGSQFKIMAFSGLIFTAIWGLSCSVADFNFAGVYRQFADKLHSKYKNETVWFTGESGFKWYMNKEGFNYLLRNDSRPKSGDIIVVPQQPWPIHLDFLLKRAVRIDNIVYNSVYPVRTMNREAHAGFYSQAKALLPFSVTRSPYEIFTIYRLK